MKKNLIYVTSLLVLAVAILVIGAVAGKVLFVGVGILVTLLALAAYGQLYRIQQLGAAEPGTTRSKVVKQNTMAFTVQRYTDAGWQLAERTLIDPDAKHPSVKLTFRKA